MTDFSAETTNPQNGGDPFSLRGDEARLGADGRPPPAARERAQVGPGEQPRVHVPAPDAPAASAPAPDAPAPDPGRAGERPGDEAFGAGSGPEPASAPPEPASRPSRPSREPAAPSGAPAAPSGPAGPSGPSGGPAGPQRLAAVVKGRIDVADEVVEKVAGLAAIEVEGVADVGGDIERALESVRERIGIGQKRGDQGIKARIQGRDVAIDVTIMVEYGHVVLDVARRVQRNVAVQTNRMLGLNVVEVNVNVDDVRMPRRERDDDRQYDGLTYES
ncbi:MAG TPA: Asp23/Gls24 family envelope stress response protein [Acidimicrobiales bacterium]